MARNGKYKFNSTGGKKDETSVCLEFSKMNLIEKPSDAGNAWQYILRDKSVNMKY